MGLASAPAGAAAHTRSTSYSSWQLDADGALVRLRIRLIELTRLPPALLSGARGDRVAAYLAGHLRLRAGDARCEPELPPRALRAPEGWALYEWRIHCPSEGQRAIESAVLLEVAPSHLHFARIRRPDGAALERVLSHAEPRWELTSAPGAARDPEGTSFGGYVTLGVEHIATGWDHLAFVLALLLLARTFGEVAALVTSFTIAHSVTLALAVLGVVHPDAAAVEALIGFSIALVAAENAWLLSGRRRGVPLVSTVCLTALAGLAALGVGAVPASALAGVALFTACHFALLRRAAQPARLRAAVAFGFGLVHGFGFAGVLAEIELPTDRLAPALFGFNVGVELGQLVVVALVWPGLRALARWKGGHAYRLAAEAGSATVLGLGVFWFATRTFG